jgi:hypothetical protein
MDGEETFLHTILPLLANQRSRKSAVLCRVQAFTFKLEVFKPTPGWFVVT